MATIVRHGAQSRQASRRLGACVTRDAALRLEPSRQAAASARSYAFPMAIEITSLIAAVIQLLVIFAVIYWAVRLAIRHERVRKRRS